MNQMPDFQSQSEVRKSITVARDIATSFQVWTNYIHLWWPAGHSLSGDDATQVYIEGGTDGRVYEVTSAGEEIEWGRLIEWAPPRKLAFTWYLGSGRAMPTRVDIEFIVVADQMTRVELVHRGPELIGELWAARVSIFNQAWDKMLDLFAEHLLSSSK